MFEQAKVWYLAHRRTSKVLATFVGVGATAAAIGLAGAQDHTVTTHHTKIVHVKVPGPTVTRTAHPRHPNVSPGASAHPRPDHDVPQPGTTSHPAPRPTKTVMVVKHPKSPHHHHHHHHPKSPHPKPTDTACTVKVGPAVCVRVPVVTSLLGG